VIKSVVFEKDPVEMLNYKIPAQGGSTSAAVAPRPNAIKTPDRYYLIIANRRGCMGTGTVPSVIIPA